MCREGNWDISAKTHQANCVCLDIYSRCSGAALHYSGMEFIPALRVVFVLWYQWLGCVLRACCVQSISHTQWDRQTVYLNQMHRICAHSDYSRVLKGHVLTFISRAQSFHELNWWLGRKTKQNQKGCWATWIFICKWGNNWFRHFYLKRLVFCQAVAISSSIWFSCHVIYVVRFGWIFQLCLPNDDCYRPLKRLCALKPHALY